MFSGIFILKIEHTPFKRINHMRILVFVVSFMLSSVGHMYMSVQEILRAIFFHQIQEHPESLMRKISPVIQFISRCMRHKDIKSPPSEQLKPEFMYAFFHAALCILMLSRFIAHRTAQPQDPDPFVHINLIVDADASFRRNLRIFIIVISAHIEYRCLPVRIPFSSL